MLDFLKALKVESTAARTLYVPAEQPLAEVNTLVQKVFPSEAIPLEIAELATNSRTGAVLFWSPPQVYLVLPPFPVSGSKLSEGYDIEPLYTQLKQDFKIALILVRLGAYAIGLCQGENLITSKVGTGLVHGRHKKGGSSQQRFRRHREKQIEYFLTRVCEHTREKLELYARGVDYVVYGGARTTILLLQKQCPFLGKFECPTLPPLLDIPDPRLPVLEAAVRRIWSSTVVEWREEEKLP